MRIETAKYSSLSDGGPAIFELETIFMISENAVDFDIFRQHNANPRSTSISPLDTLKNVYHQIKSTSEYQGVLAKIVNDTLYVLCAGGAGVMIYRDGHLIPLLKTTKGDYSTASGHMKPGDSYIFATHEVFVHVPMDTIKESLADSASASVKRLTPLILEKDSAAVLVINVPLEMDVEMPVSETAIHSQQKNSQVRGIKGVLVSSIDSVLTRLPNKSVVVREELTDASSKRRSASLVGFILLIILSVSIFFGLKADKARRIRLSYEPQLKEAQHNLDEAKELAGLSPVRAQELLLHARSLAIDLQDDGVEDEELTQLLSEIQQNLGSIAGIYEQDPELFLDLSIISSEFKGNDIAFSDGIVRVLDSESKRLVGIDVETKRTEIIAGSEFLPDALSTFAYEDRSFIISSDGIREVTNDVDLVIKPDWNPQEALAASFAGNVYVVNKENGEMYRYQGVRGGFLEPEDWLGEGIEMDYSKAVSMAIDGEIWVLESDGVIDRLSGGIPQRFSLSGERVDLNYPTQLYTDEESDYLYILDTADARIAVFEKNGQYVGEYTNQKLAGAADFIISESNGKALFLAEARLYSLELKHIQNEASE